MGVLVQQHDLTAGPQLIFAPHGDDELLGCGGWLVLTKDAGVRRIVVFCTTRAQSRNAESATALAGLGLSQVDLKLPERGRQLWTARPGLVAQLRAVARHVSPAYIFVPSFGDPHPDHRQTHALVSEMLAGPAPAYYQPAILQYEGLVPLPGANWWLDISAAVAEKQRRLGAYQSQERRYGLVAISDHLNAYRGRTLLRRGISYAEGYQRMTREEYLRCVANLGF
jgi:N-acetylglucosamine malate deacetylase 1